MIVKLFIGGWNYYLMDAREALLSTMSETELDKEVDAKIVKLAQVLSAKVLTNDFNLNKIAELHGVTVLNINELANALKPIVLPGEQMTVKIAKEGKEHNQGIAYLDDGTMIVCDNAKHLIGKTVNVVVTSVLQTSAGRMIFANRQEGHKTKRYSS